MSLKDCLSSIKLSSNYVSLNNICKKMQKDSKTQFNPPFLCFDLFFTVGIKVQPLMG